MKILNQFKNYIKSNPKKSIFFFGFIVFYYFSLPKSLFSNDYATVIESKEGQLIGAKIAKDGQWRFPEIDSVPHKFETCLLNYEDQYFYYHLGFNPVSLVNAFSENRKAGRVIRGGSTITQQVIRLHRNGKKRSYFEKLIETFLATRLECGYSKKSILKLYSSHAPFGSNVVGLNMASWRYFGLQPHQLSWAESACLAVLPNAPSLIFPGRNQDKLLNKRNRLLKKLYERDIIDQITYELAITEPLPQKPYDLPKVANHLTEYLAKKHPAKLLKTTIDWHLQSRVNQIVEQYYQNYSQNHVNNMAVMVVDVKTREVICYIGNTQTSKLNQKDVDMVHAARSTGSIIKPFLYASMLDEGEILPHTLVADIPTQISGYTPQNFNNTYDGAVPASEALTRSLNIPFVLMLQDYKVNKFYEKLQQLKLRDIKFQPSHYGLSLILGGAETNLYDLCQAYSAMAGTLNHYLQTGKYRKNELKELAFFKEEPDFGSASNNKIIYSAGAIYQTFQAMKEVNRPNQDIGWRNYDSTHEIAWKTGTSFGGRDAWAVGINPDYVVGVWVGNASGEGRPLLTGVDCSGPVMFDVFRLLSPSKWFKKPLGDLQEVDVCEQSGFLAQMSCNAKKQWAPRVESNLETCPYHHQINLDASGQFQVNNSCANNFDMIQKSWFVLPPVMAMYYKSKNTNYLDLPPFHPNCKSNQNLSKMDFIYPKENMKITLTKNFHGQTQPVVFKVAHANNDEELFWYVNSKYIGNTKTFHEKEIIEPSGKYLILVVDSEGNEIKRKIEIMRE